MSDILTPPFFGDYSRSLHRENMRYLGVLQKQGKPIIDADLNDQSQIVISRLTRTIQNAFPSSTRGDTFKIIQHPNPANRGNNFYILARLAPGENALSVSPESYVRYYIKGLEAILTDSEAPNEGRSYDIDSATDTVFGEIHHRNTEITDSVLTDSNARFPIIGVEGYDLTGMLLVPNVQDGTTFQITSNTENTITIGGGGLLNVAILNDYYRIVPTTPVGDRSDLIWLDVYIGEEDASEDDILLHNINSGIETSRRLVIRQQLRYDQNITELPFGEVYVDQNNTVHYAVKIAQINRLDGVEDITDDLIVDLRETYFGSSREVIEARNEYDNLKDRIDAADAGVSERYSARRTAQSFAVGGYSSTLQLTGNVYVGESPGDPIGEIVKLYSSDNRDFLKGAPTSLISTRVESDIDFVALDGADIDIEFNGDLVSLTFVLPADLSDVITQINAALGGAAGQALIIQNRLALRSTVSDYTSYVRVVSTSSALPLLFDLGNDLVSYPDTLNPNSLYVDRSREPKVRNVWSDNTYTTSVIGSPTGTPPKFYINPVIEFDMLFTGQLVAQFGVATLFANERSDVYLRRGAFDGLSDEDRRLELEHEIDGQHKADVIKDYHIDWGTAANQVSATDVPINAYGDLVTANVEAQIGELEDNKLARQGTALKRTMQDTLLMGNNQIKNLLDPTDPQDATTKFYVDNAVDTNIDAGAGAGLTGGGGVINVVSTHPGIVVNPNDITLNLTAITDSANSGLGVTGTDIRIATQGFGISGGNGSLLSVNTTAIIDTNRALGIFASLIGVKVEAGGGIGIDTVNGLYIIGANLVPYTVANGTHWSPDPTQVASALDQLASRVTTLETNIIPSGTRMLFQQSNPPAGWTKELNASYEDAAIVNTTGALGAPVNGTHQLNANHAHSISGDGGHNHGGRTQGISLAGFTNVANYVMNDDTDGVVTLAAGYSIDVTGGSQNEGQHDHIIISELDHNHGGGTGNVLFKHFYTIVATKN